MRLSNCRSCGARIVFLVTRNDRNIPVNYETVKPGDVMFDAERHQTHWETCPKAAAHRTRTAGKETTT